MPVIRKIVADDIDEHTCIYLRHGRFRAAQQTCTFYEQARKICLVVDQDSDELALSDNY